MQQWPFFHGYDMAAAAVIGPRPKPAATLRSSRERVCLRVSGGGLAGLTALGPAVRLKRCLQTAVVAACFQASSAAALSARCSANRARAIHAWRRRAGACCRPGRACSSS